jgi:hypothetical protein
MGFLGVVPGENYWTSSFIQNATSSPMPVGDNYGRPSAFFPLPRFKSTEAEREFDSQYINEVDDDDHQVTNYMLLYIYIYIYIIFFYESAGYIIHDR